jgi:AcrR family transcriptional regulator
MQELLSKLSVQVADQIFIKNPASSELGKKIVSQSVELIDQLGFEAFTFKKLSLAIDTTEASVYRYFENKHKLLLYLTAWYWGWMEYYLVFSLSNINAPKSKLEKAIRILIGTPEFGVSDCGIDREILYRIVISESSKAYLTRGVDEENKAGAFARYKQVVNRVSEIILEINPRYKYPHMLVSTVIEGAHHQRYFADHLPNLTDVIKGQDSITAFYVDMVLKSVNTQQDA